VTTAGFTAKPANVFQNSIGLAKASFLNAANAGEELLSKQVR
jgi:hypothetical protein